MEINNNCVPQLRFPEFVGEWEMFTMEDLFDIRNGYTPSKYNPEFWEGGTIPWFRMEDIRQNGHILSDSIQHVTPAAVKGAGLFPAYSIIVATTATIGEHALIIADSLANQRFTFLTKRKSHDNKLDMLYFQQYMFIIDEWCKKNTNAGGLLSVNMPAFKKLSIPLPSLEEQNEIVECLEAEDRMIAAQEQKVESLKAHKKGLMQQLFPQPGATTPALRFPGFTGEWQEKPLYSLAAKVNQKNKDFAVTRVLTNSATEGVVDQNAYFERDIAVKDNTNNYYIVDKDDFVYNPRISSTAPVGPISINKVGKGIMSPLYTVFKFQQGHIAFFEQYFQTEIWHPYLKSIANIGARFDRMNITTDGFFNMPLFVPSIEEQQKIAECLETLDNLITAESKKLESLKAHKKGLMKQLFPQLQK